MRAAKKLQVSVRGRVACLDHSQDSQEGRIGHDVVRSGYAMQLKGENAERAMTPLSRLRARPNALHMFGPNYGAAQSHIEELMKEREDFIQASKAQARRVAELEASLAAATELHEAAQEQLEVQSLIAEHRATRIHELEEETRAQANTMGKCVEPPHCATRPRSAASGTAPRGRWDPASRDACSVRGV